jgi:DNA mismatch endonuclease, patch repair protein
MRRSLTRWKCLVSSIGRKLSPEVRYRVMSSIPKTNTRPELALRRALRKAGLIGYRLYPKGLPGRPDVTFTRWKVAVFVDGVFWHGHPKHFQPGTKGPYWDTKIRGNIARDERVNGALKEAGWAVVRMWDLDVLRDPDESVRQVAEALGSRGWAKPTGRQPPE